MEYLVQVKDGGFMHQVLDYIKCNHCEVWGEYLNNEPILNEIVEVIYNATTSFKINF